VRRDITSNSQESFSTIRRSESDLARSPHPEGICSFFNSTEACTETERADIANSVETW